MCGISRMVTIRANCVRDFESATRILRTAQRRHSVPPGCHWSGCGGAQFKRRGGGTNSSARPRLCQVSAALKLESISCSLCSRSSNGSFLYGVWFPYAPTILLVLCCYFYLVAALHRQPALLCGTRRMFMSRSTASARACRDTQQIVLSGRPPSTRACRARGGAGPSRKIA